MPPPDTAVERAWELIDQRFDETLERIRSYLRQPSVSGTGEGIEACAALTAEMIEGAGGTAEVVATDGHPVVLGTFDGSGPKLLRYAMYDVQPADEPDWTSPPFAAEIHELPGVGRSIVARGSANSKGCLAAFLFTLEAMRDTGDLPVRVTMLVDGEEELGSLNLPKVVESHRDRLTSDAAFDLDLTADSHGTADVFLGCKGILSFRLVCKGGDWGGPPERALHSSGAVVVGSPVWSLNRALGALVDEHETPLARSLTVDIPGSDDPFRVALSDVLDPKIEAEELGVRALRGTIDAKGVVDAYLYKPAISINGIQAGYPAGNKTIIPHVAEAVLDVRLPYSADADAVLAEIRELIDAAAPEVTIEDVQHCPAARTPVDSPIARAMIASHAAVEAPTRVWPSAPWWAPYHLFEGTLGVPFAVGGVGHADRAHASDEYATVEGLRMHMKQVVAFLHGAKEQLS